MPHSNKMPDRLKKLTNQAPNMPMETEPSPMPTRDYEAMMMEECKVMMGKKKGKK